MVNTLGKIMVNTSLKLLKKHQKVIFIGLGTSEFYHDGESLNEDLIKNYTSFYSNLAFYNVNNISYLGDMSNINGMLWRYFPVGDLSVDIVLYKGFRFSAYP